MYGKNREESTEEMKKIRKERNNSNLITYYEGAFKIFRTGTAIYTAVVVARSTSRWWDYRVW
jgi:hypothetical protein